MTDIRLTESQQAAISALMHDEGVIPPPLALARGAYLRNDNVERDRAEKDPDGFWAEQAGLVDWIEPWTKASEIAPPDHAWFLGGKLNASANCLDRHVHGHRRNQAALIWIGEDGEEHTYTYARLYREVNRFANALKRLGVGKGDRVVVYMPLVPEGIITMLACARIGAIHSVVCAAVIGLPDPIKGERIKAFVVLRKGVEAGPGLIASLKDHVRQDLGPIAQPSEIEVRDSLPKTRSGKIVRRYLKAVELGKDPGDLSTLAD